ncbi:sulfatase family protein [Lignipirellula cremea]|uniref:Choline-sulfatase n=1 Tax=Lignipirellula cremea TaxID=2528010 RepID=A0A518DLE9_9BACT|nr:sulfatase [Lignipirellula cremea]QDU92668.1 Choline-sulfatase [Lignipirellula cremea]
MNRLSCLSFCALASWIGLLSGATGAAQRPNILLIVSEDNGPELGCYGDPYAQTPHLDQLASQGVRFENAFVPYSVCSPSRACFLTGLYPHQNGQIGLATHKFALYRGDTPNFVSLLKEHGYHTGLIGKLHVNPESAFPFDFHAIPGANFNRSIASAEYAAEARKFFAQAGDKRWFLSVNFPDAHLPFLRQANGLPEKPLSANEVRPMPWVGVDTPRLREQAANYYNCLARLDHAVGLLLAELDKTGEADHTLLIYIGDHGAQFPRGKGTVYEGGLRVPMIVRWPHVAAAGQVRKELVSTIDLLPTALRAVGKMAPANLPGWELQPLLAGEKPDAWRQYNFGFTTGSFPRACFVQHAIRDARYKLISSPRPDTENLDAGTYLDESHQHFVVSGATAADQATAPDHVQAAFALWQRPPRYELYDLENDPHEWRNLADDPAHAAVKTRLIKALIDLQRRTRDPFLDPANVEAFVQEQLANRDLGYRNQQDFRWSYLNTFPKWRARP